MDSTVGAVSTQATTPSEDLSDTTTQSASHNGNWENPASEREDPPEAPATTTQTATAVSERPPPGPSEIIPNPLVDGMNLEALGKGVLIPLKTVLEVRQNHAVVQMYITRAPSKSTADILSILKTVQHQEKIKNFSHLRRCAKPADLPAHLKTQLMNESPEGRQVHTGKSTWNYILVGEVKYIDREKLATTLASIEGIDEPFIAQIPVPLNPPICQVNATMWTSQFWPAMYRKNNPLGPHPSVVARATEEIKHDAHVWMSLAHRVAMKAKAKGIGEAMGAVIVQREDSKVQVLGIAGDARWCGERPRASSTGNPMAHCALRAISMVAQKLVRHERRVAGQPNEEPDLAYNPFQDQPLLEEERIIFEEEHPNPDGYLCHGLELYLTHEPCVQCSMGILHSRMGKVVFAKRQTLAGGMCSEDRGYLHPELSDGSHGEGLGLFWRKELNWTLLAWEWEPGPDFEALPQIKPTLHP